MKFAFVLREIKRITWVFEAKYRGTLWRTPTKSGTAIYEDFARVLIGEARRIYLEDDFGVQLKNTTYALDSTTIDLCLSLFPWAHFRKRKGAIKLHTLLDLRGNIPSLVIITHGKVSDVKILDRIPFEAGSIYVMDRGYVDFAGLYGINQCKAFFVTRAKSNFDFQRIYSHHVDKSTGLQCDQTIMLSAF